MPPRTFTLAAALFVVTLFATPTLARSCTAPTTLDQVSEQKISGEQGVAWAAILVTYFKTLPAERSQFFATVGMGHLYGAPRPPNEKPYDVTINGAHGNWVHCEAFRDEPLDKSLDTPDSLALKLKVSWRENETTTGQLRVEFQDIKVIGVFIPAASARSASTITPNSQSPAPTPVQPILTPPQAKPDDSYRDDRDNGPLKKAGVPTKRQLDKAPVWLKCSIDEPNLPKSHMTIGLRVWQEDDKPRTDLSSAGVGFPFLQMCSYDPKARKTICNRMADVRPADSDGKFGVGVDGEIVALAWEDSYHNRVLSQGTVRIVDRPGVGFVYAASEPSSVRVVITSRFYRKNSAVLDLERHGVCRG